ncbi:MAG: S1C family serine protease [Actinobacteria bacterium]|nr:S1C family serine protease [Actinomycetota bacterium]
MSRGWFGGGCLAFVLLLAACGGGSTSTTTGSTSPAESVAETTQTTTPSGQVSTLDDAASAVVRIEARGTFVDQAVGAFESAGSGSGFIIDPSGIAVTNNHVVTGAGILQVYVGEDQTSPLNARVLAVSECSDLAVIDIDGEGFPYLSWYDGEIKPGVEVFSAGFPFGTDEYTLTGGIVSKKDTVLESAWASVDHVIEHDARIRPGNSGGPLLTADGQVIGVNYAGEDTYDFNFAISVVAAQTLVEQLRGESNVDALGLNGSAIYDDASGLTGVWVSSVESGSPADLAEILPGDVVLTLEGVSLSTDGTMAEYCDVIRSHTAGDVLAVEVLRYDTNEFLEGRINGTPLEVSVSFANELSGTVDEGPTTGYTSYTSISDDTGAIVVDVPSEWLDVDGRSYTDDAGNLLFDVSAAPDLIGFLGSWDVPGVSVTASSDLAFFETEESILDGVEDTYLGSCEYGGREVYVDPVFAGFYDLYVNCGGVGTTVVVLAATPDDLSYVVVVQFQAVADRDFDALDAVLDTFNVIGEV